MREVGEVRVEHVEGGQVAIVHAGLSHLQRLTIAPTQARRLASMLLDLDDAVPARLSDRLRRCPVCGLYFVPQRNAIYCRDSCRATAHYDAHRPTPGPSVHETTYVVTRMRSGDWKASMAEPGQPPRPVQLPSWEGLYIDHPRSDTEIADDSTGADQMTHVIIRDAFRRADRDIGEYYDEAGANQRLCRWFVEERLRGMRPGQVQAWSESFIRDWVLQAWQRDPTLEAPDSVQSTCHQARRLLVELEPWVRKWEHSDGRPPHVPGVVPGYQEMPTWPKLYARDWQHHVEAVRASFQRVAGISDDRLDAHASAVTGPLQARTVVVAIEDLVRRAEC